MLAERGPAGEKLVYSWREEHKPRQNMSIQDLGAIGELVGGVAVIASVLYLAVQIRHGLQGYQSNITQQITNHFSTIQVMIASDEGLMTAWAKGQSGMPLTEMEQARLLQIVSAYIIGFENMYFQLQSGMLAEEAYDARRPIMASLFRMPGVTAWWREFGVNQHPKPFVAEIEKILPETGDSP